VEKGQAQFTRFANGFHYSEALHKFSRFPVVEGWEINRKFFKLRRLVGSSRNLNQFHELHQKIFSGIHQMKEEENFVSHKFGAVALPRKILWKNFAS
jgi:hypothetical protein